MPVSKNKVNYFLLVAFSLLSACIRSKYSVKPCEQQLLNGVGIVETYPSNQKYSTAIDGSYTFETPKPIDYFNDSLVDSIKVSQLDLELLTLITPDQLLFNVGRYEVTQKQWLTVMGMLPPQSAYCDDCPVEISNDRMIFQFLERLNRFKGSNYRLPSVQEWKYLVTAGEKSYKLPFPGSSSAYTVAWFHLNCNSVKPVGKLLPNEFGIYDLAGNVSEACTSLDRENLISMGGNWSSCLEEMYVNNSNREYTDQRGSGLRLFWSPALPQFDLMRIEGGRVYDTHIMVGMPKVIKVRSFYCMKYEVTQKQWMEVMGWNPSEFKSDPNLPVENVSLAEVQEFIKRINILSGKKYRLPTANEWEYAFRGGQKTLCYKYSGSDSLELAGWSIANSGKSTHPVGLKVPNELGVYDLSGNVSEVCYSKEDKNFGECGDAWNYNFLYKTEPWSNFSETILGPSSSLGFRLVLDE